MCVCVCVCVCVKLATVVKDDLKAPFSIATTPRLWAGATPFPGLPTLRIICTL